MSSPGTAMRPGGCVGERRGLACDDQRPDAVAERGARAQRAVAIAEARERADAELRQLELAAARRAVQILDVAQRTAARAGRAPTSLVHHRVERERVVRDRARSRSVSSCTWRPPATRPGSSVCSAAKASPNIQRARSCSSTSFETTRSSSAGTPASRAARRHAVPLHRLDVGVACRRRRGRSSRSDARAPSGRARRAAASERARSGPGDGSRQRAEAMIASRATRFRSPR